MDIYSFVYGPLLWLAFITLLVGVALRLISFFVSIWRSGGDSPLKLSYVSTSLGSSLLPYRRAFHRRPLYAALRYIFHACLFVVPIFLSGHIVLWEESRFGWRWVALPDTWADGLTLLVLGFVGYFMLRRLLVSGIRRNSSIANYLLLLIIAFPFMTGFFLAHETLTAIPFLGDHMYIFHALSGEFMIILVPLLFCKLELKEDRCTGCAVCEEVCPTGALSYKDEMELRIFFYLHYRCISCGSCVGICPEKAAELQHEIGVRKFFQSRSPYPIRSMPLSRCERCGALFAPEPQMKRIGKRIPLSFLSLCPRCRLHRQVEILEASSYHAKSRRLSRLKGH